MGDVRKFLLYVGTAALVGAPVARPNASVRAESAGVQTRRTTYGTTSRPIAFRPGGAVFGQIAFSPDGRTFAYHTFYPGNLFRDARFELEFRDAATGRLLKTLLIDSTGNNLTFLPDGKSLVLDGPGSSYGEPSNLAQVVDLDTGKAIRTMRAGSYGNPNSTALSRDGKLLATAGNDAYARLFDLATGRRLRNILPSLDAEQVLAVAFSLDGKLLATGASASGRQILSGVRGNGSFRPLYDCAKLWDPATGRLVKTLSPTYPTDVLEFGPDGKTLLVRDAVSVSMWSVAAERPLWQLKGARAERVVDVAYNPERIAERLSAARPFRAKRVATKSGLHGSEADRRAAQR